MKRIISVILITVLTIMQVSILPVNAKTDYTAEEVADLILSEVDYEDTAINRLTSLISIMNVMNFTNYWSVVSGAAWDYYGYWDGYENIYIDNYLSNAELLYLKGYLYESSYSDMFFGEEIINENGEIIHDPKFFDNTTAGSCISIMIRALNDKNDFDFNDIEIIYNKARECGLLIPSDIFYNNPEHELTVIEFREILIRFLNQKKYKYQSINTSINVLVENSGTTYIEYLLDENRGSTYLEYLNTSESSWLNRLPAYEYRVICVENSNTNSIKMIWRLDISEETGEPLFPIYLISAMLYDNGVNYKYLDDGTVLIDNGMGDTIILYPNSNKLIKNGSEYELDDIINKYDDHEISVSNQALGIIFNNELNIEYFITKMYFNICVSMNI